METENKRVLTPELIFKKNEGTAPIRVFKTVVEVAVLGFLCLFILLIGGGYGLIIDAALIALYVFGKINQKKKYMSAYFRILPAGEKRSRLMGDNEDGFNVEEIDFGPDANGKPLWVRVPEFAEYQAANPGDRFYVGFYGRKEEAFTCYSCDRNTIGPGLDVR